MYPLTQYPALSESARGRVRRGFEPNIGRHEHVARREQKGSCPPLGRARCVPAAPARRKTGLTGASHRDRTLKPGWTLGELTERFIEGWLEDYCIRAPREPGLLDQMNEHAQACFGMDAESLTGAIVVDLEWLEEQDLAEE